MSLKISNHYPSYFPIIYSASTCFYYSNFPQSHQLSRSFENSFTILDEQIPFKQKANTHLHNKSQRHNSNATASQLYQSIDSSRTTPKSSSAHRMKSMHRSDSYKNDKRQQFTKQESIQKLPLISQRSDTIHENQPSEIFSSNHDYCRALRDRSATISVEELTRLLNELTFILRSFDNSNQPEQQLHIIIDILNTLICVRPSILVSASQNEFFSLLPTSFTDILHQWCRRTSSLSDQESSIFHTTVQLIQRLIKDTDDIKLIPSWVSDSALLEAISTCLTDIANSGKFLDENNKHQFKSFTHLIDAYTHYQQRFNDEDHSQTDKLVQLLDPILHCLTSSYFINTFTNMSKDAKSMTNIEKFFLIKCPAFLTSYKGSRLEQTMENLLSTMLPRYVQLLDKLVSSAHNWKRSMMRSVHHLLEMINYGADQFQTNAKVVSEHLSLIDNVLKLVNEPIFYNNLHETLSNSEIIFMDTCIRFLANMISEPGILAHIKQCQVADSFLRLISCKYQPLVLNVYTLLAYTTREEDIKAMYNPGRLLTAIIESLKTTLNEKPAKKTQIEQLLETLKSLVQHDQIKDEIIKQNALPFLLECTNKLTGRALVLILEILWCLTFFEEIACALRANSGFLQRVETISKDNSNEPLKKAADGLIWKLIQESESLEKVAKQEEEQEAETEEIMTTTKIVVGENGEEQVVTRTKRGSTASTERSYRYDVMISYCHADKELTYKIHKFLLDQGFKVWIDLDSMYGPAMSAMADAVENSEFVIMCMSDSYKRSTYCQAEAEYAFKCKRRLIPLVMKQGYKPDGWLGFMIGSRMYINFGRFDFDIACEKLLTEISLQRTQSIPAILIDSLTHEKPADIVSTVSQRGKKNTKPSSEHYSVRSSVNKNMVSSVIKARQSKLDFFRKSIDKWTESDVLDFLLAHHLNQLTPLCEGMNGRAFIQFYKMCLSRRLRAYSVLKDELKSTYKTNLSVSVYSQFLSVTEEAINSPPLPIQSAVLSSSIDNPPEILSSIPFAPAPDLNAPYDFSIITNASPLDTLKMVELYGSQLQLLDSLRRQITNVF